MVDKTIHLHIHPEHIKTQIYNYLSNFDPQIRRIVYQVCKTKSTQVIIKHDELRYKFIITYLKN